MGILVSLLITLLQLAVVGGIVAAVIAARRRQDLGAEAEAEANGGIGTVLRLYFYVGTFAYMVVAGFGVVLVVKYVLDELFGPPFLSRDLTQLALGLVLAMIWTPAWAWHRLRVQRLVEEKPAERRSLLRKLYAYLTLAVTAALVAQASVELLRWILGATSFSGYAPAAVVVWSALWAFHWTAESAEGQPSDDTRTVRRLYLYATSAYSLTMLAVGLSFVVYLVFREAYEGLFSVPSLLRREEALWGDAVKSALSVALVGAGLWAWHWLYAARVDRGSDLRQFYLYGLPILGGVLATLAGAGSILFGVLQWLIGTPDEASATAHFRFVPAALAPLLIGSVLWLYHWSVVQQERAAAGQLQAARRTYAYIMTALGLGTLAAAIIVLVPTVIEIGVTSARDVLAGGDWWRDRIVLFVTLGLLGGLVWGYYWFLVQRRAAIGGAEERASFPRRFLLYGVLGIGTLVLLGTVTHILFVFLDAMLEDTVSLSVLRDTKWSIGGITAAALIVPYHWLILQEDRPALAERAARPTERPKTVTVLTGEGGDAFLAQLETAVGRKVRVLRRADPVAAAPELSTDDLADLARRIASAAGDRVLVVADATGVQVYSYR